MKRSIQIIACVLGTILTCSCHNVVKYDYGKVGLNTRYWHDNEFVNIEFGGPHKPYNGSPALLIKMSDGTVLNLATASVSEIQEKCPIQSDCSGNACSDLSTHQRPPNGTRWPEGTTLMKDDSRRIYVLSNQVIAVRIYWDGHPLPKPEVGNPRTGEMHTFPLSKETVVSLFGKPKRVTTHLYE